MTAFSEHTSSEVFSCVVLEKQEVGPTTLTASALISSKVFPLVPSVLMSSSTDSKCYDRRKEGPENQHPSKHSLRLEDIRVGTSAGFISPLTKYHLSRPTTLPIDTTRFSTQAFQLFSLPLIQHNATFESDQQYTSSTSIRPFTPSSTSLINLLSNKHPNNSNLGIVSFLSAATFVLEARKETVTPQSLMNRR